MKQLIRIPLGIIFSPMALLVGTWVWLFEEDISWWEEVGITVWHLASGQWEKLPD